jgi:hypothetical protein
MPRGRPCGERDEQLLARAWVRVSGKPLDGIHESVDIREIINLVFLLNYRIFNLSITPSIL